jgi:hypothetical protein
MSTRLYIPLNRVNRDACESDLASLRATRQTAAHMLRNMVGWSLIYFVRRDQNACRRIEGITSRDFEYGFNTRNPDHDHG